MFPLELERLKRQYAGKRVVVDARRPELSRWVGRPGRVVAVNWNGCALVQFEGPDPAWFDIEPKFLHVEPLP